MRRRVSSSIGGLMLLLPKDIADKIETALSLSETEYKEMCHRSREKAVLLLSEETFLFKYIKALNK